MDVGNDLFVNAALEWIAENTVIDVDPKNPDALDQLPACAQLFVAKYGELMKRRTGVISQSIEGLSQSFDSSGDLSAYIWALANSLLGGYLRSQVHVIPAKRRW